MSVTVLSTQNVSVDIREQNSFPSGAFILLRKDGHKHINYVVCDKVANAVENERTSREGTSKWDQGCKVWLVTI